MEGRYHRTSTIIYKLRTARHPAKATPSQTFKAGPAFVAALFVADAAADAPLPLPLPLADDPPEPVVVAAAAAPLVLEAALEAPVDPADAAPVVDACELPEPEPAPAATPAPPVA